MLPDESAHVFIIVGEFLNHVNSPAGRESYFNKPMKVSNAIPVTFTVTYAITFSILVVLI